MILSTKLKVVLAMIFWGGTFASGRYLSQSYHPFAIAFLRFGIASIFFIPALFYFLKWPFALSPIQWLKVIVLGVTGIFSYNYFFFGGLSLVEAGKASVIIAINPAITAFLASVLLKESIVGKRILGAALALLGALVVVTQGDLTQIANGGFGKGELLLFGGVSSWVSYTLIGKIALKRIGPLQATGLSCLVGTALLFPFALENGLRQMIHSADFIDWSNLFFLGFFATFLGFIWYYQGIHELGAARAASFINLVPVFGVAFGSLFLGETISISFFAGAILVIAGIRLSQLPKGS